MSINPNINPDSNNIATNTLEKNTVGYHILSSSGGTESICEPLDKDTNYFRSNGENPY